MASTLSRPLLLPLDNLRADSPPPTPSADLLTAENLRFKSLYDECEWVEDYRPGGYHPVHIGDAFNKGRYRVIRKLGEGSFSTAWLAVVAGESKYVALKIMSATESVKCETEFSIFHALANHAGKDDRSNHVLTPLDSFEHLGPNGIHSCLVFEPMGPDVQVMVRQLAVNKPAVFRQIPRYPVLMAKKILKQTLMGLAYLHANGIVHGDLHPGNMLFALSGLDWLNEEQLEQDPAQTCIPVERRDGKEDLWAPRYMARDQPLHEYVKLGADLTIKISDLGAAFWETGPPKRTVIPLALRAPEILLKARPDSKIDIWAFGCLVYELLCATSLFNIWPSFKDRQKTADTDHYFEFSTVLGPLPESMTREWPSKVDQGKVMLEPESLEFRFGQNKHPDISEEEAKVITRLIRGILQYDLSKRPTAEQLLQHPWFAAI